MSSTITISNEAQKDIEELQNKINDFHSGDIPEECFKAFRYYRSAEKRLLFQSESIEWYY